MEKRPISPRRILSMFAGVLASVCMFMNWFPLELDLGIMQFNEVLGKVNAFTLPKTLHSIEEAMGMLTSFLPKEFRSLQIWSVVLAVCAVTTVVLNVSVIALYWLKKTDYIEYVIGIASVAAVSTVAIFCSLVTNIYDVIGAAEAGYNALSIVFKSPCLFVLVGSIVSGICTDTISEILVGWMYNIITAVRRCVAFILEWVDLLLNNIGFLASDIFGALVGILAGKWVVHATDSTLLSVVIGLFIAGVVATVCALLISKIFGRKTN